MNNPTGGENGGLTDEQVALYGSLIIGLGRVYDVLLMMYAEDNPKGAAALRKMHEEGRMWYPPPSYREEDE